MATIHEISADLRKELGKGASRRLRLTKKIPAILYGGRKDPVNIQLDHFEVLKASASEWFYSAILDMKIDGEVEKVLLRDMQRHPFKQIFLHMDFQRIIYGEVMTFDVPLHFLNEEKSPAGKISNVVVSHSMTSIEIECLPKDLPEYIEVDLAALEVGDIIHLSDVKLPAGIIIPELALGKEHDAAVVTAQYVAEEVEEEIVEEESAEVPVIKKAEKKDDKKDEGDKKKDGGDKK